MAKSEYKIEEFPHTADLARKFAEKFEKTIPEADQFINDRQEKGRSVHSYLEGWRLKNGQKAGEVRLVPQKHGGLLEQNQPYPQVKGRATKMAEELQTDFPDLRITANEND